MTTNDENYGEGKDKNSQKNSTDTYHRNIKLYFEILSGENKIVENNFRKFLRNGHFKEIRSQSQKDIKMWEDDLFQTVNMSILKKIHVGQFGEIRSLTGFIYRIIKNRCITENDRLKKHVSIDIILKEKDYEKY
jgi:hypothetical protein